MKPVWHIYYATKGAAGAYVDALLAGSRIAGVPARAFVSANYRYSQGKFTRLFFPVTDFTSRRSRLIRLLRGAELACAYALILPLAVIARPRVVIHLIDDLYITYLLFKLLTLCGLEVSVTCHDVSSHYLGMNSMRFKILSEAKNLIVHNPYARDKLIEVLGASVQQKIASYPFPFSSYDEILSSDRMLSAQEKLSSLIGADGGYYLFLGVVRKSKGIETLLDAWSEANDDNKHKLVIAGSWTDPGEERLQLCQNDSSCTVINRYLSDEEFVYLIQNARFVVLPYLDYAHSSVVISCAHHQGAVIVSDVELFRHTLGDYDLTFTSGDKDSLAQTLRRSMDMDEQTVQLYRTKVRETVTRETEQLPEQLREAYLA